MMMKITADEIALVRAAASLAAHAPDRLRAAHLSPRLEALARRMSAQLAREAGEGEPLRLPRAA